jgi:hypothetical protein
MCWKRHWETETARPHPERRCRRAIAASMPQRPRVVANDGDENLPMCFILCDRMVLSLPLTRVHHDFIDTKWHRCTKNKNRNVHAMASLSTWQQSVSQQALCLVQGCCGPQVQTSRGSCCEAWHDPGDWLPTIQRSGASPLPCQSHRLLLCRLQLVCRRPMNRGLQWNSWVSHGRAHKQQANEPLSEGGVGEAWSFGAE